MVSAYDYPAIYQRIGITGPGKLGCIMLDLEPFPVLELIPGDVEFFWPEDDPEGRLSYAKGPVGAHGAHATLLYGLTPDENAGVRQRESVDELLEGLDLSSVKVASVGFFPGQFGLPYACLIAHVTSPDLIEANRRLRFLPHVDTFPDYRPHATLAYVKVHDRDRARQELRWLIGSTRKATGINYGGPI